MIISISSAPSNLQGHLESEKSTTIFEIFSVESCEVRGILTGIEAGLNMLSVLILIVLPHTQAR